MANYCAHCGAPMDETARFCPSCGTSTTQTPPPPSFQQAPAPQKDRIVAGILALLLGGIGVHYFYCNKVGGGFICMLLCLVTCDLWSILVFVQGIVILVGTQEEFERKWVRSTSTFPLF